MQTADNVTSLAEKFNSKRNNSSLVESHTLASISEIISLVKTIINQPYHLYKSSVVLLFKSAVQNKVLYGCQSWSNLSTTDINRFNISYNNALNQMLSLPTSTPNCYVYLEFGVILII